MRIKTTSLIFTLLIFTAGVQVTAQCDPESVYQFGKDLETQGEYYRAISEYTRLIYFWPEHSLAPSGKYHIGLSYLAGQRYELAVSHFLELVYMSRGSAMEVAARYGLGTAYYQQKRYEHTLSELHWLSENDSDSALGTDVEYARIWCHLQTRDMDAATAAAGDFARISPNGNSSELRRMIEDLNTWKPRKPWLAGTLSAIIPGSGQVYAGRWRDGVVSFVINSLFISGCISAMNSGHDELAVLLGLMEVGWYSANIYNAMNNTHKMNYEDWDNHLKMIDYRFGHPFPDRSSTFGP